MDDEWAPLLSKDCMLYTPTAFSADDDFHLTTLDYSEDEKIIIKKEPVEETSGPASTIMTRLHLLSLPTEESSEFEPKWEPRSPLDNSLQIDNDYHGSTSGSPSSSLSSPDMKDNLDYHGSTSGSPSSSLSSPDMKDNLGVDLSFCIPFNNNSHHFLNSPTSSNGSPFGQILSSGSATQQHSPLPPVSHFSHQMPAQEQQDLRNQQQQNQHANGSSLFAHGQNSMSTFSEMGHETITFFDALDERTPSPPTSERSSPSNGIVLNNVGYGMCNGGPHFQGNPGVNSTLTAAQQQLKSRSKMHEMADPRSQGLVQLSAEERRTLVQEGYPLSAQESRRKRKEYMDNLESRCQAYYNENVQLKNRMRQLEVTNQKLMLQVKKLQETMGSRDRMRQLEVTNQKLMLQVKKLQDTMGSRGGQNSGVPAAH
ncbi:unnamed protein product [Nippostrongylus brasiliensis]|uniref:Cyclic AMP response element-binding protein A (inferred by orthology to a D. melanogaster protein) n=1 Tax=Nippostrongylus brasiliensis TaxID=27835 RepID=A0A0N4Y0Z6_NIPBR|nr:unnamed protein product [Nippostrongylus brasiliensis]